MITERLESFIEQHPDGWDHRAWLGLLTELEKDGIDIGTPEQLGMELEGERLAWELRRRSIPGLGPKRIEAVVDRFHTFWSLRQASPEDVAEIKTVPLSLAEKVCAALRD